jgi:hypothetical protein
MDQILMMLVQVHALLRYCKKRERIESVGYVIF